MTRRLHVLLLCALSGTAAVVSAAAADGVSAPQSTSVTRQAGAPAAAQAAAEFRIGPGDVLEILVWNDETLSRSVTVRPDGRISVPLLNDVVAATLTPMQLRDVLTKGFSRYRSEAEVSVMVSEIHSLKISVVGQVKTPGRFDLKGRMTVLEALALAGGFTDFARKDRIVVHRTDASGRVTPIGFDYQYVVNQPEATNNFVLMPGDIIIVP